MESQILLGVGKLISVFHQDVFADVHHRKPVGKCRYLCYGIIIPLHNVVSTLVSAYPQYGTTFPIVELRGEIVDIVTGTPAM